MSSMRIKQSDNNTCQAGFYELDIKVQITLVDPNFMSKAHNEREK